MSHTKLSSAETYISIRDVTRVLGLPSSVLKKRVNSGSIKAIMLDSNNKTRPANKTEPTLDEREAYIDANFAELKGVEIMTSSAARKYDVHRQNISNWVNHGHIKNIGFIGKRALLDEADVAYCVAVYRERGGTGRWLFNDDGTPYTPKRIQVDK